MDKIAAEAALKIVRELVAANEIEPLNDEAQFSEWIADIIQSALSQSQAERDAQLKEQHEILMEALKVTEGHWDNHGGQYHCDACNLHYKLLNLKENEHLLRLPPTPRELTMEDDVPKGYSSDGQYVWKAGWNACVGYFTGKRELTQDVEQALTKGKAI